MKSDSVPLRVSNPPSKPLLIWDGDCRFCELWVERWRVATGGQFDDSPSKEITSRYPQIPAETFDNAVVFIDETGRVFTAAEAIFRSMSEEEVARSVESPLGNYPAWAYFNFAYDEHWHHRGQLYSYLRLLGKEPPMLYDSMNCTLRMILA